MQAVTVERLGPFSPYLIETCPAASLTMSAVMKNGEIIFGLPPLSKKRLEVSSMTFRPPIPEPITTAIRSRLPSVTGRPESSIAKWAAPIA